MWHTRWTCRLGVTTSRLSRVRRPPGRKHGTPSSTTACVGSGRRNERALAAAWQMNDTFPPAADPAGRLRLGPGHCGVDRSGRRLPAGGGAPLAHPLADEAAEVPGEALVLVRRVGGAHRLQQQPVEVGGRDPVEHELVDVREAVVDEVAVAVDLEVVVGQLAVARELLLVAQVLAVA